jgi:hypothetical protein
VERKRERRRSMMKRKSFLAIMVLTFVLGFSAQAMAAYRLAYFMLNLRYYEGGATFNRFYMQLKDENQKYPMLDKLQSLTLYDPNGKVVPVKDLKFTTEVELDGGYDGERGLWNYMSTPYIPSYHYGVVKPKLIQGTYRLVVQFDGVTSEMNYVYNGAVQLPIVKASTIKTSFDKAGNLICEWPVSFQLSSTNPGLALSARPFIEFYRKSKWVGTLYIKVPFHLGRAFVPKSVLNTIKKKGDTFKFFVRLQTYDNNVRTYSKPKPLVFRTTASTYAEIDENDVESSSVEWVDELDGPQF